MSRRVEAATPLAASVDFRAFSDDDPDEKSTEYSWTGVIAEAGDLLLVRVAGVALHLEDGAADGGRIAETGRGGIAPTQ
ncbi:MAG: hypothetical protein R2712_29015 [Vicinamibacterales bacterium]